MGYSWIWAVLGTSAAAQCTDDRRSGEPTFEKNRAIAMAQAPRTARPMTGWRRRPAIQETAAIVARTGPPVQSGFKSAVTACTGIASPWPDRTFFRTPTIDILKMGVPPI